VIEIERFFSIQNDIARSVSLDFQRYFAAFDGGFWKIPAIENISYLL